MRQNIKSQSNITQASTTQKIRNFTQSNYLVLLSKLKNVHATIPETVIYGYGFDTPTMLHTTCDGRLNVVKDVNNNDVHLLLWMCNEVEVQPDYPQDFKPPIWQVRTWKRFELWYDFTKAYQIWTNAIENLQPIIIQKFVVPPGNRTKSLRAEWSHHGIVTMSQYTNRYPMYNPEKRPFDVKNLQSTEQIYQLSLRRLSNSTSHISQKFDIQKLTDRQKFITTPFEGLLSARVFDRLAIKHSTLNLAQSIKDYLFKQKSIEIERITFEYILGHKEKWYLAHVVEYESSQKAFNVTIDTAQTKQISRPVTCKSKKRIKKLRQRLKSANPKLRKRPDMMLGKPTPPKKKLPRKSVPRVDIIDHTLDTQFGRTFDESNMSGSLNQMPSFNSIPSQRSIGKLSRASSSNSLLCGVSKPQPASNRSKNSVFSNSSASTLQHHTKGQNKRNYNLPGLFDFKTPRATVGSSSQIGDMLDVPAIHPPHAAKKLYKQQSLDLNYADRVKKIREHIQRQNNSLYLRIHYQDALAKNSKVQQAVGNAVNETVNELDSFMEHTRKWKSDNPQVIAEEL